MRAPSHAIAHMHMPGPFHEGCKPQCSVISCFKCHQQAIILLSSGMMHVCLRKFTSDRERMACCICEACLSFCRSQAHCCKVAAQDQIRLLNCLMGQKTASGTDLSCTCSVGQRQAERHLLHEEVLMQLTFGQNTVTPWYWTLAHVFLSFPAPRR